MNDKRMKKEMLEKDHPFDAKRMIWGGFKPFIENHAAPAKPKAKMKAKKK